MTFTRTLLLVCAINLLASCATRAPQKTQWIEEALLHDGRIVHVTRTIKTGLDIALIRLPETKGAPQYYAIETNNPNTGETILWEDDDSEILPILIDFDGAVTYLVVYVTDFDNTKKQYACVFPPYVFLRHQQGKKWVRVNPEDAPAFIQSANLSFSLIGYDMKRMPNLAIMRQDERERISMLSDKKRVGYQTVTKIRNENMERERSGYLFQIDIPRRIADLKTKKRLISDRHKFSRLALIFSKT
ncbi:hypothetical protein [Geomonas propionica]|uniref:Lipoprotein n=1 Tax=Geomonas propionica TaxID=2798582 RepID=A0ABS0YXW2_9BACT|nr:hypothetical protein [Geomonas propionica]MBJ6802811.1 hypothetical protein [Geomonas propionica]